MTTQVPQTPRYDALYQRKAAISSTGIPTTGARDGDTMRIKAGNSFTGAQQDQWWFFIYDASSAYWYPSGDNAPIVGFTAAAFTSSAGSTFQDTLTPKITIPFAGDYTIEVEALANNGAGAAACLFGVGHNAVTPGTIALGFGQTQLAANTSGSLFWKADFTAVNSQACAVGDTVSGFAWTNNGTPANSNFTNRRISVKPLRVH